MTLILLAIGANGVIASGDAEVAIVVSDYDVDDQNVTAVELELTNHGAEPVDPLITVTSQSWWIQNPWDIVEGPEMLAPGETAHYRIEVPGERARPKLGDRVTVMVLDEGTQRRSAVGPATLDSLVGRVS
jgi:hypothetical protein